MGTKNVASQASKKNTRSVSQRSCHASTIRKRPVHGMETRRMPKVATVVIIKQMAMPSPKQQDFQQKVPY